MELPEKEELARIAALCNRLGRLWAEQDIDTWDEAPPLEKIEECRRMLVGKVLSNSSIHLPAFQSAMHRAWRTESWRFSNNLVLFQPWQPNTPLHRYDFSKCAFWVQVFGLPLK